jgi:glyoxylase-like metal-dependent hydrolase (beta-lactamase superfamily II)
MRTTLFTTAAVLLLAIAVLAISGRKALAAAEDGWVTVKFGELTITALSDTTGTMPFSLFSNISAEDFAALAQAGGAPSGDGVPSWINAFLVAKGDDLYLVDTGMGAGPGIVPLIEKAGYTADKVTHVLITHFHSDHIGGLLDAEGKPAFPNATLYTPLRDEEYFIPASGPDVPGTELAKKVTAPYKAAGKYQAFDPGAQISPGVTSSSSWGHTPGHTGFAFASPEGPFMAWGDIVHAYLIQFARPEVTLSFDVDQPAAAATRREVYNKAADGKWLVAGAHLPFPALGHVVRKGAAFDWVPYEIPAAPAPSADDAPAPADAPAAPQE